MSSNLAFPSKDQLERAKLTLELIIYFTVVIFIAVAVIAPQRISQALSSVFARSGAQLEEVDLLFVKFKLTDTLSDAQSTIITLRKLVVCEKARTCTPEQSQAIDKYVSEGDKPGATTTALTDAIKNAESIRAKIQQQTTSEGRAEVVAKSDNWIVIFSASQSLDGAKFEIGNTKKDFPKTQILFSDGWYRTVVVFDTESEAKNAVGKIASLTRQQPYVRNLNAWCPNAVAKADFTQCGSAAQ
jgi:hypothetical protein